MAKKNEKKEVDYRAGQKVVATIVLEDWGQDPTELDVLENGVILGYSPIFRNGRLSLVGVGALDGMPFTTDTELLQMRYPSHLEAAGHFVYFYDTGSKKPLPWKAQTLKYPIVKIKKASDAKRFIKN